MTDGKAYTFTYTAADEAKTQSSVPLTATDGTIDSLNLTPLTITAGKATTIKYQTIDKNGVILSEKSIGSPATGIEVNTTNNDGYYTSAGNLYLANVDDSATIVVSYHTYKYENGQEIGVIEKTFTVKAIDSATVAAYDYTIAKSKPYNWSTTKKSTQIAMEDTAYNAYIRITDANGDALNATQASEYSVESSNNNVLLAAGTADGAIALTPVAQGTAYLVVSKDGKNVTSLPVSVVAKRVLTSVQVDTSSVAVATDSAVLSLASGDLGSAVVNVKTLDQYGVDITATPVEAAKQTSKPAGATGTISVAGSANQFVVSTTSASAGTYGYKVTFADNYGNQKSAVFSVRVIGGSTVTSIKLAASEVDSTGLGNGSIKSVDTTLSATSTANKNIMIHAVGVGSNGVVVSGAPLTSAVSVSAIKVTGSDGTVYAASGAGIKTVTSQAIDDAAVDYALATATTSAALQIKVRENVGSYRIRKYLPAGVYTVQYTVKDSSNGTSIVTKTYSTQFTIKDEQPATTIKVSEPSLSDAYSISNALKLSDYATFSYDGVSLAANGSSGAKDIHAVVGAKASTGTKATVQYVVAEIPVGKIDGTNEYSIDTVVPVNVTFTGLNTNLDVSPKSILQTY